MLRFKFSSGLHIISVYKVFINLNEKGIAIIYLLCVRKHDIQVFFLPCPSITPVSWTSDPQDPQGPRSLVPHSLVLCVGTDWYYALIIA